MRSVSTIRIATLAAIALCGCVSGTSPVLVTGFYPLQTTATTCGVDSSATQLAGGLLNTTVSPQGFGYVLGLAVDNQLASDADNYRTENNYAYLDSVTSTFHTDGTLAPPPSQTVEVTAIVEPSAEVFLPVTVLSQQSGQTLEGQAGGLVADITVNGHFEDGTTFTTAMVSFPITLTNDTVTPCGPLGGCGLDAAGQADGYVCE